MGVFMNVYDMDKTIYNGDSTADFCLYCFTHHPKTLLYLPYILGVTVRYYVLNIGTKTEFKGKLYRFLKSVDTETEVEKFWDSHIRNMKAYYLEQKREDDVIVSASPEFLLKPLEKHLNIHVIASKVSPTDGTPLSENCYYEEKVKRFREIYPDALIDDFYSDSYSDEPLAKLAKRAFIVKGEERISWDFSYHKKKIHI